MTTAGGTRARLADALARRRVTLGFAFAALVLWLAEPTVLTIGVGAAIAAAGEALRIWAAGHLSKAREVTSSGPYRWLGHPLYVGSSIMGVGLAIACANLAGVVLIAVYLATTLTAAIRSEEAYLRRAFGEQYELYKQGLAAKRASPGAATRRFSLRQVIANREHRAIVGLVVAILLLALKATYNALFWRAAAGPQ